MDESEFPPELAPLPEHLTDERWRTDQSLSPGHPRHYQWQILSETFSDYERSCREYTAYTAAYLECREELLREEQRLEQLHGAGSSGGGLLGEGTDLAEYVERLETAKHLAHDSFLRADGARERVLAAYVRWEVRNSDPDGSPMPARRSDLPRPSDGQPVTTPVPRQQANAREGKSTRRGLRLKHS